MSKIKFVIFPHTQCVFRLDEKRPHPSSCTSQKTHLDHKLIYSHPPQSLFSSLTTQKLQRSFKIENLITSLPCSTPFSDLPSLLDKSQHDLKTLHDLTISISLIVSCSTLLCLPCTLAQWPFQLTYYSLSRICLASIPHCYHLFNFQFILQILAYVYLIQESLAYPIR